MLYKLFIFLEIIIELYIKVYPRNLRFIQIQLTNIVENNYIGIFTK